MKKGRRSMSCLVRSPPQSTPGRPPTIRVVEELLAQLPPRSLHNRARYAEKGDSAGIFFLVHVDFMTWEFTLQFSCG